MEGVGSSRQSPAAQPGWSVGAATHPAPETCGPFEPPPHQRRPCRPRPSPQVLLAFRRAKLDRKLGRANIHLTMARAVEVGASLAATQHKIETVEGV